MHKLQTAGGDEGQLLARYGLSPEDVVAGIVTREVAGSLATIRIEQWIEVVTTRRRAEIDARYDCKAKLIKNEGQAGKLAQARLEYWYRTEVAAVDIAYGGWFDLHVFARLGPSALLTLLDRAFGCRLSARRLAYVRSVEKAAQHPQEP